MSEKINTYTYCTYPQVYFNTLDHCYYQFVEIEKSVFNSKRYQSISNIKSKYFSIYVHESSGSKISIRFPLYKTKTSLERYSAENTIKGTELCSIFLQLLEAVSLLHRSNSYHGNIMKNTIFYDPNEDLISLSTFKDLDGENDDGIMSLKDREDIKKVMIGMIKDISSEEEIDMIIEELEQFDETRIQWLKSKTDAFFTTMFINFLKSPETTLNPKNIQQLMFLNDIIMNRHHLLETLVLRYMESYYDEQKSLEKTPTVFFFPPSLLNNFMFFINLSSHRITHNYFYQQEKYHQITSSQLPITFIKDQNLHKSNSYQHLLTLQSPYETKLLHEFIEVEKNITNHMNVSSSTSITSSTNVNNQTNVPKFLSSSNRHHQLSITMETEDQSPLSSFQPIPKQQSQIYLYCKNSFRLLNCANKLRSKGFIVKCFQKLDDNTLNDFNTYYISILTAEEMSNKKFGELKFKVRFNNEISFYSPNDFIKKLSFSSSNSQNYVHSLSFKRYSDDLLKKTQKYHQRNMTHSPMFTSALVGNKIIDVARVQSCKITDSF